MNAPVSKIAERGFPGRRAVAGLLRTWRDIRGTARVRLTGKVHADLPPVDLEHVRSLMRECVEARGGEVSARARAADLGRLYLELSDRGRVRFLRLAAREFALDDTLIDRCVETLHAADSPEKRAKAVVALQDALVSSGVKILKQFNTLPDGFKFLVDLRADLMPLTKDDPALYAFDREFKQLLASYFDIGLLDMQEIRWTSPAALLEKLIAYEAVHKIKSWDDLRNRLDSDRRCFAFFHNKMPLEPLIFVEVALVRGMSDNIQHLLDEDAPQTPLDEADYAMFYSISNTQKGLGGISFGNFLIKRVVDHLSHDVPNLKHYATLSPIPGFRRWLDPLLEAGDESILKPGERVLLSTVSEEKNAATGMRKLLDMPNWHEMEEVAQVLEGPLTRLCAHYLLKEKSRDRAKDPVARFHLTNGARMERLNWLADTSAKGVRESAGLMVNYYYKLSDIDDNHEDYMTEGKIAVSKAVKGLL